MRSGPEAAACVCFPRFSQQREVLVDSFDRPPCDEIDHLQVASKFPKQIARRMKGRTQIRTDDLFVLHDEMSSPKRRDFICRKTFNKAFTVRRDEKETARGQHPSQLAHPCSLQIGGQMCKYRERVDQFKVPAKIGERWGEIVDHESGKRQVVATPVY